MTAKHIPDDVLGVLKRSRIDGHVLYLPESLPRPLYVATNKVIEALGGKWNRKAKGHVFDDDPSKAFGLATETGTFTSEKEEFQFYPTPYVLAAQLVELADIRPDHRVLEPSAGVGNILRAIGNGPDKVAVELNPRFVQKLMVCGVSGLRIHQGDFLQCNGELGTFDRIVMNPPFGYADDVKHIRHALKMLRPGGRLVSVCANGPRQREQLMPIASGWIDLPAGSFKEAGTNVNTAVFVFDAKGADR